MNKSMFYDLLEKSDLEVQLNDGRIIKCSNLTSNKKGYFIYVYNIETKSIDHFYEYQIVNVKTLDTTFQLLKG